MGKEYKKLIEEVEELMKLKYPNIKYNINFKRV